MSKSNLRNIDYGAHYFVPLEVVETVLDLPAFGFMISDADNTALVECTISEAMYGKVQAVPLGYEDGLRTYRPEKYYESDFISSVRKGIIIKKETETQHVELVNEWEPLTDNTYIVHNGYAIAD
jgi:hypothetical protein